MANLDIEECFKITPFKTITELAAETGLAPAEVLKQLNQLKAEKRLLYYVLADGTRKYYAHENKYEVLKGNQTAVNVSKTNARKINVLKSRFLFRSRDEVISLLLATSGIQE